MGRRLPILAAALLATILGCTLPLAPEVSIPSGVAIRRDPQDLARRTLDQIRWQETVLGVRLAEPRIVRIAYYGPGQPIPKERFDGTASSEPCGVVSDIGPDPGCWLVEAEGTFVLNDRSRGRRGWFLYVDDPDSSSGGFGFVACWGSGADPANEEPCPEASPSLDYDRLPSG